MNKKILILLIVVIIISASTTVITTYSLKLIEQKEEDLYVIISADPTIGTAPLNVSFSSFVANNDVDIKYQWDFGNGQISQVKEPTVIYKEKGNYTCNLTVTNVYGKSSLNSIRIIVNENKPPIVILSINQNTIERVFKWTCFLSYIPLIAYAGNQQQILDAIEKASGVNYWGEGRIIVTAQINDPENDKIVSYNWTEQTGDTLQTWNGKTILPKHNIKGNNSIKIPELYTWIPNQHVVTLTITDSAGNIANSTTYFTVSQNTKENKITQAKKFIFTTLLMTVYKQLFPEEYKHLISDPFWKFYDFIPILKNLIIIKLFIGNIFPQPIPKAVLNNTIDTNIFNHSNTVNQNGGVSKKTSIAHNINIKNVDKLNTAKGVYIKLKNPAEKRNGLNTDLGNDKIVVSLQTANTNETLYANKEYTDGFLIGDLTPGSEFNAKLIVTFLEVSNNTFKDSKNYDCTVFVYQSKADYWRWTLGLPPFTKLPLDEIKFTIIT